MIKRTFFTTAELVVQTNRSSKGQWRRRQDHKVKTKKGNKDGRKTKKKNGGTRGSSRSKKKIETI